MARAHLRLLGDRLRVHGGHHQLRGAAGDAVLPRRVRGGADPGRAVLLHLLVQALRARPPGRRLLRRGLRGNHHRRPARHGHHPDERDRRPVRMAVALPPRGPVLHPHRHRLVDVPARLPAHVQGVDDKDGEAVHGVEAAGGQRFGSEGEDVGVGASQGRGEEPVHVHLCYCEAVFGGGDVGAGGLLPHHPDQPRLHLYQGHRHERPAGHMGRHHPPVLGLVVGPLPRPVLPPRRHRVLPNGRLHRVLRHRARVARREAVPVVPRADGHLATGTDHHGVAHRHHLRDHLHRPRLLHPHHVRAVRQHHRAAAVQAAGRAAIPAGVRRERGHVRGGDRHALHHLLHRVAVPAILRAERAVPLPEALEGDAPAPNRSEPRRPAGKGGGRRGGGQGGGGGARVAAGAGAPEGAAEPVIQGCENWMPIGASGVVAERVAKCSLF